MKRIPRWLNSIFSPKDLNGLDVQEVLEALSDSSVRKEWMYETLEELKRLNLEIDKRLLNYEHASISDLAARRKAYQDMLESILTARRRAKNPNPRSKGEFDLDSVTVQSV